MTQAPAEVGRPPTAILTRLLAVLALLLCGVPQGQAAGIASHAGSSVEASVEQTQGMLSAQRHLLRAQLPEDTAPEAVVPGDDGVFGRRFPAEKSAAPKSSFKPATAAVLPPLRGPPAA